MKPKYNFDGKQGAPKGNNNKGKNHRWRQAIDKAVKQYHCSEVKDADGKVIQHSVKAGQALDAMALRLVKEALHSEDYKFAMTEIGNRLDGKPTEHKVVDSTVTQEHGGVSEALGILLEFARRSETHVDEGVVSH